MNALVSYQWLKELVGLKETPAEFAARVSVSGPGVERWYPQDVAFERIVTGQIRSLETHPNADKLRVVQVDIGAAAPLTIVCGGSNLVVDQWVVVALVGSKVRWHGEGELIELVPTTIRGVASEGMICAADEIGLKDAFPSKEEKEILDLGLALPELQKIAGQPLADLLGYRNDVLLDVEVTTNRPDAMGTMGMAREAAAILSTPFLWQPAMPIVAGTAPLEVVVEDSVRCPRYMAVRLDGITIKDSPWWLKKRLLQAGVRPINNVVDCTNYVMLELGQPMHAFDAQKVSGGVIRVRGAKQGEKIALLNGATADLKEGMLVIADAERPLAVAGVMGGTESAVSNETTSIILEAAAFDSVSIRRTARALNVYSDAQLRFEKGLSTQAPADALARTVELCEQLAGANVASVIVDTGTDYLPKTYSISVEAAQALIGVALSESEMQETLTRLGFQVSLKQGIITAVVPWWRDQDIEDGRDLVEEIARVYGYTNIPAVFPAGLTPRPTDPILRFEDRIRVCAQGAGLTEVYSYSLVSKELLAKAGYGQAPVLAIANPLSVDLEVLRPSLIPSLIQVVVENQERAREQSLFELAHQYIPRPGELPLEDLHLAFARLGDASAWKQVKGWIEHLTSELGIPDIHVSRLEDDARWHPGRSFRVWSGETLLGHAGELHPTYAEAFKIEGSLACADLTVSAMLVCAKTTPGYLPVSAYPEVRRDLAVVLEEKHSVEHLTQAMQEVTPLLRSVEWFDTYKGKGVEEGKKSLAFHLTFVSEERTLETKEVDELLASVEGVLQKQFNATRRG